MTSLYSELEVTDANNLFVYIYIYIYTFDITHTRPGLMDMLEKATWCLG